MRKGRGSRDLVRGRDQRYWADQTSSKGKGKGSEGRGEHGSKGGAGSKGTQQVENLVVDEVQENIRAMKSEEEEEDDREGGCEVFLLGAFLSSVNLLNLPDGSSFLPRWAS